MRLALALSAAMAASSSLAAPALDASNCESVVRAFNAATDGQHQQAFDALLWPDGFTRWPTESRRPWSSVRLLGPHPKYRTYIRETRVLASSPERSVLSTKEITLRLSPGTAQYTGDYTVTKVSYTCLKRRGQWRIFSQEVTSRNDLVNEQAAREWRRNHDNAGDA